VQQLNCHDRASYLFVFGVAFHRYMIEYPERPQARSVPSSTVVWNP
jgi:hypothetical protein